MNFLLGHRIVCSSRLLHSSIQLHALQHRQSLGVSAHATPKEIKDAFYKLSKENHPDLYPDDRVKKQKYLAITEAYSALLSESKTTSRDIKAKQQFNKGAKFGKGSVGSFFF